MSRLHGAVMPVALLFWVLTALASGVYGQSSDLEHVCNGTDVELVPLHDWDAIGPQNMLTAGGVDWAYHRFGATSDAVPTVVLVKGEGTMLEWPLHFLLDLAQDHSVVIFDNRDQGHSEEIVGTEGELSVVGAAQDTANFIAALNLTSAPDVIGQGLFGGSIAITLAALHGHAVNDVVALGGSAGSPLSEPPMLPLETSANGPPTAEELLDLQFPLNVSGNLELACYYALSDPSSALDPVNDTTTELQESGIGEYFLAETRVWDAVPSISNPLLLIGGELDVLSPPSGLSAVADRARNATLVLFPDAAASAWLQYYDEALAAITQLLGGTSA